MADILTLTNIESHRSSEPFRTAHTFIDLCDPCASSFVRQEVPVTLSPVADGGRTLRIRACPICRRPGRRWRVETQDA